VIQVTTRRQFSARVLLLIFVPLLLLASVHRHAPVSPSTPETTCYACAHHVHHDGHISLPIHSAGSCVLCQFLALTFLSPSAVAEAIVALSVIGVLPLLGSHLLTMERGSVTLRGPPARD
jgi:hypothetical protein